MYCIHYKNAHVTYKILLMYLKKKKKIFLIVETFSNLEVCTNGPLVENH